MFARGKCPGCRDTATFTLVDIKQIDDGSTHQGKLYMYPSSERREPIKDFSTTDQVPEELARAYMSAIDAFNAGIWDATANSIRRTLEGVAKTHLDPDNIPNGLYNQLDALVKVLDLDESMESLAHTLREAGHLGAHFDLEREVDRPTAEMMLDLTDYLIEYIYVLPGRIRKLEVQIEELSD